MKKSIIFLLMLLMSATMIFAEHFRMGSEGSIELMNRPKYDDIVKGFDNQANIIPGLYWEVLPDGRFGFGNTYLVKFNRVDSELEDLENEWYLDWIGSWDFRYHFFKKFLIDPFVEAGIGCAGRVEITDYEEYGYADQYRDPLFLSLFAQIGGGLSIRLKPIHVGAKALYRFYNEIPPVTDFEPYPLKNFNFALFVGFSF